MLSVIILIESIKVKVFMRLFFSYSPSRGLVFFFDHGQELPVSEVQESLSAQLAPVPPAQPATPAPAGKAPLLSVREATVEDYPPNHLAVDCAKCGRRVLKGTGYKRISESGFLCEGCQYNADLPIRQALPVPEVQK